MKARAFVLVVVAAIGCNEVVGIEPASLESESRTEPKPRGEASEEPPREDDAVLADATDAGIDRTCKPGFFDCNDDDADGCETDLSSAETCGACNARCPATAPVCVPGNRGGFSCATGCTNEAPTLCGATCTDLASDPSRCGSCTKACPTIPNGHATCADSVCATACNEGAHRCGVDCVKNDAVATCGKRCSPCPTALNANATCNGTSCGLACKTGFASCDGTMTNGCEVNVKTNRLNCGGCGKTCGALQVCTNGKCV